MPNAVPNVKFVMRLWTSDESLFRVRAEMMRQVILLGVALSCIDSVVWTLKVPGGTKGGFGVPDYVVMPRH